MLFVLPSLAIISVIGIFRFIKFFQKKSKTGAFVVSAGFFLLLVFPLLHQINTFPVDYVYFNSLAGGNKNAWGNYEYDYYFHALKEPVEELIELVGEDEIVVVMNSNLSNYFEKQPNINYEYTRFLERSSFDWDYGIFGINYLHPHLLKNKNWQPAGTIKTYFHRGNPVAVLVKRTDKNDFSGISEIKNGNLSEGIRLLEGSIEHEPNNVWLFVYLAQAKLTLGDISGFEDCLKKGRKIHPYFEPFYLMEATYFFNEDRYQESFLVLNQLFEVNPRYLPAKELLEKLKKRL